MGHVYQWKSPPNLIPWRPLCHAYVSRISYIVSQACIGVAAKVSPIPVYPCAANHGDPQAFLPPNPTPWIPRAPTMSFTPSFCDVRSIDSRETAIDVLFTLFAANMWFQEITACCE